MLAANWIASSVLLLIAGYVLLATGSYPSQATTLGPAFFPRLVGGVLAALAVAIILGTGLGRREPVRLAAPQARLVWTVVCLALYVAVLPRLGFVVATPAFLSAAGLALAGEAGRWWRAVVISAVVTTAAVHYLFSILLDVPLP
jgi:hypothetical protein